MNKIERELMEIKANLVNATHESFDLIDSEGVARSYPCEGLYAHIETLEKRVYMQSNAFVSVFEKRLTGLPEPKDGVIWLVTPEIKAFCKERHDVAAVVDGRLYL